MFISLSIVIMIMGLCGVNAPRVTVASVFILAANPTAACVTSGLCRVGSPDVIFPSGHGGSDILQLNATGGFTGTVSLNALLTPGTGLTAGCSPASVPIGGMNGNTHSDCSYSSTVPGSYSVVITGSSGALTHSVTAAVTVIPFTMGLTPAGVSFNSASTGSATLTLIDSGFNETATLSATTVPATGLTVTFTPSTITLNTKTARTPTSTVVFSSSPPPLCTVTISQRPPARPCLWLHRLRAISSR